MLWFAPNFKIRYIKSYLFLDQINLFHFKNIQTGRHTLWKNIDCVLGNFAVADSQLYEDFELKKFQEIPNFYLLTVNSLFNI